VQLTEFVSFFADSMMATKSALVLGGTGATGKSVVEELRKSDLVDKIVMITRRTIEIPDGPGKDKIEQRLVDFDKLEESKEAFTGCDLAFCCLGNFVFSLTGGGKAGKAAFVKVEYDYVVNSAKLLKEQGSCTDYHLMSSQSAKASAWDLYHSTKGKAEDAIKELNFARLSLYRPGLLIAPRENPTTLEKFSRVMARLFDKSSGSSIKTEDYARAIVFNATKKSTENNCETIEHADIVKLAKEEQ